MMNLRQIIYLSEQYAPNPLNDRDWIYEKIESRAKKGYWYIEIQSYEDMPGGGTLERLEAVLKVLEDEGFKVTKSSGFSGSFRRISWSKDRNSF